MVGGPDDGFGGGGLELDSDEEEGGLGVNGVESEGEVARGREPGPGQRACHEVGALCDVGVALGGGDGLG